MTSKTLNIFWIRLIAWSGRLALVFITLGTCAPIALGLNGALLSRISLAEVFLIIGLFFILIGFLNRSLIFGNGAFPKIRQLLIPVLFWVTIEGIYSALSSGFSELIVSLAAIFLFFALALVLASDSQISLTFLRRLVATSMTFVVLVGILRIGASTGGIHWEMKGFFPNPTLTATWIIGAVVFLWCTHENRTVFHNLSERALLLIPVVYLGYLNCSAAVLALFAALGFFCFITGRGLSSRITSALIVWAAIGVAVVPGTIYSTVTQPGPTTSILISVAGQSQQGSLSKPPGIAIGELATYPNWIPKPLAERLPIWSAGKNEYSRHPFGSGPDNATVSSKTFQNVEVHNEFANQLLGTGPFGLAVFFWLLIAYWIIGGPITRTAMISWICLSTFNNTFSWRSVWIFLAFALYADQKFAAGSHLHRCRNSLSFRLRSQSQWAFDKLRLIKSSL